eukprot:PhF_6_TR42794/c0_g1_i1/m.64752/K14797/ENP1, BYSL; essential nuclear protein 1
MGKAKSGKKAGKTRDPLETDIMDHKQIYRKGRRQQNDEDDETMDVDANRMGVMAPKMTSKLLAMAREEREAVDRDGPPRNLDDLVNEDEEDEEDYDEELEFDDHTSAATDVSDLDPYVPDLDPEEAAALAQFQPKSNAQCRTLADIILSKIQEKKDRKATGGGDDGEDGDEESPFDKKVVRVYRTVGKLLKSYTIGRLPKAFKFLPQLKNWEDLLWLTKPQDWSPHALYAATRLFASGLNEKMAQRYYYAFLLPSIVTAMENPRTDSKMILHPMRYRAIRKAMFKPAAFMKGFLIPFCEEETATVQAALVIGAILHKCTVPAIPAAVALVKISEFPFSPASAIIMRAIIDKRLSLPVQAIDATVAYFHRFIKDDRELPVLWHQLMLSFLTKYGHELLPEQLPLLRDACHKHYHIQITPDVYRELARLERQ